MEGANLMFESKIIFVPVVLFAVSLGLDISSLLEGEYAVRMRRVASWLVIIGAIVFVPVFVLNYLAGRTMVEQEPYVILQMYFAWGAFIAVTINATLRIILLYNNRANFLRIFTLVASILTVSLTVWMAEAAEMAVQSIAK
jgi:hypothetical protein